MAAWLVVALEPLPPEPPGVDVGLRVDPVVFAVGGASVGVDAMFDDYDAQWRASLAAFHVDVPALLVPVVVHPSDGVGVVEDAVQLGAFVDADPGHRGVYVGPELYAYRLTYNVHDGARVGTATAYEAYVHVTGGYTWFPFDSFANDRHDGGFYVQPWATLGLPVFHSGGADVATSTGVLHLEDRLLNWHATVAVGWRL